MRKGTAFLLIIVVLTTSVGCDQITKDFARDTLQDSGPVILVPDLIHLVYAENGGIAFGIGSGLSDVIRFWLFVVGIISVLVTIGLFAYQRRERGPLFLSGATILLAGGASNLLDRLFNDGNVVDFLMINIGFMRMIVFNVADLLVFVGAILLVWSAISSRVEQAGEMSTAAVVGP